MKEGWELKNLGDVLKLEYGKPLQDDRRNINGAYPMYGANGVKGRTDEYYYDKKTIIVGRKGSAGEINLTEEKFWPLDVTYFIIFDESKYDLLFLYHLLTVLELPKLAKGVKPGINRNDVYSITTYFPPLHEQQRIVAILDEAFAAIDKAKANAEQNLKNAKELFESYLQGVFTNNGEGWEEMTIGDVCSLYQGIAINAKTKHALVEKSDLPLLRIKDLRDNTEEQYIDPNNYPKNALVNESDIIYTRTGNSLGLVFRGRKGVLHNNSFKIVPDSTLSKDYLFIWLQNPAFKSKIFSLASKAAQPDITHAIFKVQKIVIPPLNDQQTIVKKLDLLSAECKKLEANYQKKIADLEELKKSILQKAFSGELKTLEEAVGV